MFNQDFLVLYLRVIEGCNLNCTHCFTLGNSAKIKSTPTGDIVAFLTAIKKQVNPKVATVYLHGGETFLRPVKELRAIIELSKEVLADTKTIFVPQTNLVYPLTKEIIDFIKVDCNNEVGVSWDYQIRFGSIREDKAIEKETLFFNNLKTLIEKDINVHIAITQQKHLLQADPIRVLKQFDGCKSIDFELLTTFDEKTRDLKPNNQKWSNWYTQVVQYYHQNETTWSLPQVDLLMKFILSGEQQDCKCNCCSKRTFTLNTNGTVGLCPDNAYIKPISHVDTMMWDWNTFENQARTVLIQDLVDKSSSLCYDCEHFEVCGGNCNIDLFDETDECPLSRQAISYVLEHKEDFIQKYQSAKTNLPELRSKA